jgi:hypothetical protein
VQDEIGPVTRQSIICRSCTWKRCSSSQPTTISLPPAALMPKIIIKIACKNTCRGGGNTDSDHIMGQHQLKCDELLTQHIRRRTYLPWCLHLRLSTTQLSAYIEDKVNETKRRDGSVEKKQLDEGTRWVSGRRARAKKLK